MLDNDTELRRRRLGPSILNRNLCDLDKSERACKGPWTQGEQDVGLTERHCWYWTWRTVGELEVANEAAVRRGTGHRAWAFIE